LDILGPTATIQAIASNDTFAFAHEAPIYAPAIDEIFFVSNDGGPLGMSDINNNNQISKISLAQVEQAIAGGGSVNVNITKVIVVICLHFHNVLIMLAKFPATSGRYDTND
jgi:gluconolactonase